MRNKFKLNRTLTISLVAILLGIVAGGIMMAAMGSNPIQGYAFLLQGGLKTMARFGNTLAISTTLILAGLAVAFAFRTGLFNIGVSGQMLMGAIAATSIGLTVDLPKIILLPLCIIAGCLAGMVWGTIPGFLKARFNVHEVVATIMLNWIAYWIVYYAIKAWFVGKVETESKFVPDAASLKVEWMTKLFQGSYINLGFFIAVAAVIFIWFLLNKTTIGYELKAAGYNKFGAEYAGMKVERNIVLSMAISGGLAGLAGVCHYLGYSANMQIGVLPSQGFDGMAVALLANSNPLGVVATALFFGLLTAGKGFMNAMTGIPPELADTIIAFIIYFAATSVLIDRAWKALKRNKTKKQQKSAHGSEKGGE